jgi:sugar lactone lactonase YvrE
MAQVLLATFNNPHGMVCDQSGNLFVADRNNHLIRKITPAGVVTTFAGSGIAGSSDGIGTAASFFEPWGIAIDQTGNLYVADTKNYLIRKISPTAVVTTIAGAGTSGVTDGPANSAQFGFPTGIAADASGNIYVSEFMTHVIRKISNGNVTTFAGTAFQSGDANGAGSNAKFDHPHSIAIGQSGNIFVTDTWNNKIRKITPAGVVSTYAGSTAGYADGAASVSKFDNPLGICADASGDIFVGDVNNFCIRKISNGTVTTFAGTAGTAGAANGPLLQASFNSPSSMAYHSSDKYFIGDEGNELIRLINMNQSSNPLTLSTLNNVNVFCPSSTSIVTASPQGLSSYTFKEGNTVLATNTTGILSLGTLASGTHLITCTATGPLGNYATTTALSITIVDASTPVISPSGPISICSGGSATLSSFTWNSIPVDKRCNNIINQCHPARHLRSEYNLYRRL